MAVTKERLIERKLYIGGEWLDGESRHEVRSPYSGEIVGVVAMAGEKEIDRAIRSVVEGFGEMRRLPSYKRYELLKGIAEQIRGRKDEFARTMALESGKPIRDSRAEVDRAVMTFTVASEEAKRIPGELIPLDLNQASEGRIGIVRRFPIGPVLGITPFNFPLNLVAHKVAPALAAGNSILIKPSTRTPLTALLLAEVVSQVGSPAGALNVVPTTNELTQRMIRDDRFKAVTFTGSTEVGWGIKASAGKKKVILELGGNAAVIVDADADVDYAAMRNSAGAYYYAGQSCISVQRMFVHRAVYDSYVDRFVHYVRAIKIGDPLDEETSLGPLIDEAAAVRIEEWVKEAVDGGAKVLIGGHRDGAIFEPTLLENVDPSKRISCLEAFGPVATIDRFDSFQEAINRVNDSRYGLQAGVFTNNLAHTLLAHEELEVGQVIINDAPTYRIDHMPYGGVKDSGFGREGVRYTIEELTEPRLLALNRR